MKNRIVDRVISAAGVTMFVGLIQTSGEPPYWALAGLAIALYECCLWACRIARKQAKKSLKRRYITATKIDMERWADEQFNPYKEVI